MIERLIRNLTNNFARDENIFNQQRKSSFFEKKIQGIGKVFLRTIQKAEKLRLKFSINMKLQ